MALEKFGEPPDRWRPHRTHEGLATLEFGVVDADGALIRGLHVEISVQRSRRIRAMAMKFTLFSFENFRNQRVAQLDCPGRSGLQPGDHDFPHLHVGDLRIGGDASWSTLGFDGLLALFCRECNLTLNGPPPNLDDIALRS